jgi:hypothetical protein
MSFQQEYVRCGKRNCRSCPHGPYWYEYWRGPRGTQKKYWGKRDPRVTQDAPPPPEPPGPPPATTPPHWDDITDRRTATIPLAREITGFSGHAVVDLDAHFRRRSQTEHPDHGGDPHAYALLTCAWSYLRAALR